MGYIYFVQCLGYVKIGITTNVKARFSSLRSSNPNELKILLVLNFNIIREAKSKEREFHTQFSSKRHRGEWFNLHVNDLAPVMFTYEQNINYTLGIDSKLKDLLD
jgi:hypothetical protein